MRFIIKLTTFISALMIAGSVFALPARIASCPSINTIKSEGITMAEEILQNVFMTFHISQYNDDTSWAFMMGPVEGGSNEEALDTVNDLLSTMSAEGIPSEEDGVRYCNYETGTDIAAAAIETDSIPSASKMKQLLKKRN